MPDTTIDTAAVERKLRQRYDELWADIRRELAKHRQEQYEDLVQGAGDPEDFATADLLMDLNLTEIDRDVDEVRAVQHALARVKRGTYGTCAECSRPIGSERLRALPYAVLCIECQTRAEQGRKATPSM